MSALRSLVAAVRLIHPAPALAVTALSAALGAILLDQAGRPIDERWVATVASIAGSQIFVGATNDLLDRPRDELAGRRSKPLPAGDIGPGAALWVASLGLALQIVPSLRLGTLPLVLGLAATASALSYNLWLSRTPLSVLPYLVSFAILPLWIAAGVGVPLERVAIAPLLVAPFAAAAHLANALRDFDADAELGSADLAHVLGRQRAFAVAWTLVVGVGLAVGAWLLIGGGLGPGALLLGVGGFAAVLQGIRGPRALWHGMLVAAVCWTASWALATG